MDKIGPGRHGQIRAGPSWINSGLAGAGPLWEIVLPRAEAESGWAVMGNPGRTVMDKFGRAVMDECYCPPLGRLGRAVMDKIGPGSHGQNIATLGLGRAGLSWINSGRVVPTRNR
jgi:hypothetical protein